MRRHVFTILSVLSLLLCTATAVLWVRSHFVVGYHQLIHGDRQRVYIGSGHGSIVDRTNRIVSPAGATMAEFNPRWNNQQNRAHTICVAFAGVLVSTSTVVLPFKQNWFVRHERLSFPKTYLPTNPPIPVIREMSQTVIAYWLPVFLFAALPTQWWCKHRHLLRGRRSLGLCAICGYDLRATPERCPECGSVPKAVV